VFVTLLLGSSGQLGTAFRVALPDAVAPSRADLDLADTATIRRRVIELSPSRIINCAASTDVDRAEEDEQSAMLINATAVAELAAAAAELGIPFVTFSTDYVFDGTSGAPYVESSRPNPINAYGRSKLAGERAALAFPGSLIVRTSWLLSTTHRNFVSVVLDKASDGVVEVVADQWGSPTLVEDLVSFVLAALDAGATGLLHGAGGPATTRHSLAVAAAAEAGLATDLIRPRATAAYPQRALRPRSTVLGSERGAELGIRPVAGWEPGLCAVVAAWRQSRSQLSADLS
jgi:dTDP-4-dehydrorhamnose reductase